MIDKLAESGSHQEANSPTWDPNPTLIVREDEL
jgi:hypothetical protein